MPARKRVIARLVPAAATLAAAGLACAAAPAAAAPAAAAQAAAGPAAAGPAAGVPAAAAAGGCGTVRIAVALRPGGPADQDVAGEYCTPAAGAHAVDVLVPGATYNHGYWTGPDWSTAYNDPARTVAAGRAVLAYDRPGTGASTRPPAAAMTLAAEAYVLHQVIAWTRGQGYPVADVIGHSLGSVIAEQDAGEWPSDPSRLVLTGMAHHAAVPGALVVFAASAYPAMLDPKFAGRIADPLWDTTIPGTRGSLFYAPATSDPRVIAWDERSKDILSATGSVTSAVSVVTPAALNISRLVTAPVLIMNGSGDAIFCAGTGNCSSGPHLAQTERPYFPRAARLDGAVVLGTGHDLNLSTTSATSSGEINGWLNSVPPQA